MDLCVINWETNAPDRETRITLFINIPLTPHPTSHCHYHFLRQI